MHDTAQTFPQARLPPAEVHRLMSCAEYTYIDVRESDEFDEGRPAGAINFPFSASDVASFIAAIRARFSVVSKLVVGCNSGKRSQLAARALIESGFANVIECRTGFDGSRGVFGELIEPGWRRVGLPTESGSPTRS